MADNSGASSSGLQLAGQTVTTPIHAPSWAKGKATGDAKSLSQLTARDWSSTPDLTSLKLDDEFPSITQVRSSKGQHGANKEQYTPSEGQVFTVPPRQAASEVAPPSDLASSVTQSDTANSSRPPSRTHRQKKNRRNKLPRRHRHKHTAGNDAAGTAVEIVQLDFSGVGSVGVPLADVAARPSTPPNKAFENDEQRTATKPHHIVYSKLDDSTSLTAPMTPSFGDTSRSASDRADTSLSSAVNTQTSASSPEQGKQTDKEKKSLDATTVPPVVVSSREDSSHTTVLLSKAPPPERTKLGSEYEPRAIWVGSLHPATVEEEIRDLFLDCGPISEVVVKGTVAIRYAFVT